MNWTLHFGACWLLCVVGGFTGGVSEANAAFPLAQTSTRYPYAISQNEQKIARWTAETPGEVQVIATADANPLAAYPVPAGLKISGLQFAEKAKQLVAHTNNGQFLIWSGTGEPKMIQYEGDEKIGSVFAVSSDGQFAFGGMNRNSHGLAGKIWRLDDGKVVSSIESNPMIGGTFSPESGILYCFGRHNFHVAKPNESGEFEIKSEKASIDSFKVSTTGKFLVLVGPDRVDVYETETGKKDDAKATAGAHVCITRDEKKLIIGNDLRSDKIEIWDLEKGVADFGFLREVSGRKSPPFAVSNTDVVIHGYDREETLFVKSMVDGTSVKAGARYPMIRRQNSSYSLTHLCISLDSSRLVSVHFGKQLLYWAPKVDVNVITSGERGRGRKQSVNPEARCLGFAELPQVVAEIGFIGDRNTLLIKYVDDSIDLINAEELFPEKDVVSAVFRTSAGYGRKANGFDLSPDGRLAAIGVDGGISIVATESGREEFFFPADSFRLRFNSQGNKVVAIGSSQRGIADITGNRYIKLGDYGRPRPSRAEDRLVTGFSITEGIVVLNAENGETVNVLKGQEIPRFNMAGVSQNGKYFVMSGRSRDSRSRNIHIETFDVETGQIRGSMETENSGVLYTGILDDGNSVMVGSSRGLAVYDVRRRRKTAVIPDDRFRDRELGSGQDWEAGFDLDGTFLRVLGIAVNEQAGLVVLGEDTRVTAWDLSSGNLLWRSETEPGNIAGIEITEDGKKVGILKEDGELYVMPIKVKTK